MRLVGTALALPILWCACTTPLPPELDLSYAQARARAAEASERANADGRECARAEFRLGELERLPCRDGEFDVVMSNCVINLCEDKRAALAEAFRALKPGGRLCVADVVSRGNALPEALKTNEALAC